MKSPWRFLADLTARRKAEPEKSPEQLPSSEHVVAEDDGKLDSIASGTAASRTVESEESTEIVGSAVQQLSPADFDQATASPVTSGSQSSPAQLTTEATPSPDPVANVETAPVSEIEVEQPREVAADKAVVPDAGASAAKRVRRSSQRLVAASPAAAVNALTARQPEATPPDPLREAMSLNEEIAALRSALAQKLEQQNAQLRQMLARFETR